MIRASRGSKCAIAGVVVPSSLQYSPVRVSTMITEIISVCRILIPAIFGALKQRKCQGEDARDECYLQQFIHDYSPIFQSKVSYCPTIASHPDPVQRYAGNRRRAEAAATGGRSGRDARMRRLRPRGSTHLPTAPLKIRASSELVLTLLVVTFRKLPCNGLLLFQPNLTVMCPSERVVTQLRVSLVPAASWTVQPLACFEYLSVALVSPNLPSETSMSRGLPIASNNSAHQPASLP